MPLLYAQENKEADAARHFQLAHQAQDRGELAVAAREYLIVTQLEPAVAEAYASLGLVYNAQADFKQSAQALERARKLKPGLRGVDLYLGLDYLKLHEPVRAVPYLERAVRIEPTSKQAQRSLGSALWNAGETARALVQLEKANRLFAEDADTLFALGEAYRKASDQEIDKVLAGATGTALIHQVYGDIYSIEQAWPKAIGHYQRAIDLDPHWAEAHLGLGDIYMKQGKLAEAEREFNRELQANPRSAAAKGKLAEIALLDDRIQDALTMLDTALQLGPVEAVSALGLLPPDKPSPTQPSEQERQHFTRDLQTLQEAPESPSVKLALALIYARLGDNDASRNKLQGLKGAISCVAVAGNPYEKARTYLDCQKLDSAETSLFTWLQQHPHDLEADYLLGRTYRLLSLATLTTLLKAVPDSYRTHQLLAETYQKEKNEDKALEEYRIVEQAVPDLPGLHFSIGNLLWANGQSAPARTELEKELQIDPDHPEANAELGEILVAQQNPEKAISYLERAIRLEPELTVAHTKLGQAYAEMGDFAKAEVELRKSTPDDPEGEAHYQLGLVYRAMGRGAEAQQELAISRRIKADRIDSEKRMMMQDEAGK
jgi:tetratricopeptide (TPR) repeat protein